MKEMQIGFPGGARVDVALGPHRLLTDQPQDSGGGGTAPSPLDMFFASLGACAGYYVLRFLQQRGLPTEGVDVLERVHIDPQSQMADRIELEVRLPAGFPEKYVDAVVRAAEKCSVKRHLAQPPAVVVCAAPRVSIPTQAGEGSG